MSRANTKYCRVILVLAFLLVKSLCGYAINYSSVGSGDWATVATWSPSGIPAAGDNVTIGSGHTITYNGNLAWAGGTITINGTGKLIITGNYSSSGGTLATSNTSDFQVGGTFSIDYGKSCAIGGNLIVTGDIICSGPLTVGGNCTSQNGGVSSGYLVQLNVGGDLSAKTSVTSSGNFNVTGNVTVSNGYFTNGSTDTFAIGKSLIVSGNIDNQGTLTVGLDCTSQTGAVTNEDSKQFTVGGNLSAMTSVTNNGTFNVTGGVVVSNGYFTNGYSHLFNISKGLITSGNIDNQGTLMIHDNCTSTAGQIINEYNQTFSVGANMTAHSGLSNLGNMTVTLSCVVEGGGVLNEYPHNLTIGSNLTVYGGLTNNGNFVVNGNFNLVSGDLTVPYQKLMVVNGSFTKSGNINVDGTLIVAGDFNSLGGNTSITYNGNFYAFKVINENGIQAGCTSACFPNNPPTCTACQIKGLTTWQNNGSPGSTSVNLTASWWEDHLSNIGESVGPTTVCLSSSSSFELTAVDDGNLASNTFEWAVYGGTITSADNTAPISGHTASVKTIIGGVVSGKSNISVTWDATAFIGAYVAVRQTNTTGCSDGKWSVFYITFPVNTIINSQSTAAQSQCISGTFSAISVTAIGDNLSYQWYSNTTASNSGGTIIATATNLNYIPSSTSVGTQYYYCVVTGTCGVATSTVSGAFVVTSNNTVSLTSAASTNAQSVCINTAITPITYTTTGASGATINNLPTGVTSSWLAGVVTISGTPTVAGAALTYTVTLTGGCGTVSATGTITVTANMTAAAASSTPTLCINTALTPINHATTLATGIGTATGLPAGVTAAFASNTITISGTPTASGAFGYTIPLTGGCGTVNATGTITVTANMTAAAASSAPTLCINTALTPITHATTLATGIGTATGLPAGVTAAFASNTITISGTPTASGVFGYTIPLTGGCGTVSATGTITVTANMSAAAASSAPTLCINTLMTNITHATTLATGIGTATGLPAGVTAAFASNTITISGTPTASGVFGYTIPLTGGCGTVSATGTITVTPTVIINAYTPTTSTRCRGAGSVAYTTTATNSTGITYTLDAISLAGGNTIDANMGIVTYVFGWSGTSIITASAAGCNGPSTSTHTATTIADQNWTGTLSTDWNVAGNWSCNFIPDLTTNVLIPNVPNKPILSSGAIGTAKNIVVVNGSSLTVTGNTLQIAGTISNSGTFIATSGTIEMKGTALQTIGAGAFTGNTIANLIISNSAGVTLLGPLNLTGIVLAQSGDLNSGGNLTLISTATQTALIDGAGTGQVNGNVTMQRYLPSAFGYKYFSSPFSDATVAAFSPYLSTTATIPTFYAYDEENHRDSAGVNAYQSGWAKYLAGTLAPLTGYAANFGSDIPAKTVSITGTVLNGPMSVPLYNYHRRFTKGFNLVGNPYPSPIDWDIPGWANTNIDNALYFFNANTDQYSGVYSSYVNGVKTGNADNVIASMQGFFVHVSDGAGPVTGALGITNSVRINNLNPLFKAALIDDRTILRFTASFETKNAIEDGAAIYFDEQANRSFDKDKDALKMLNTDALVPNLYSISTDPKQLSINGMPFPSDSITKIPLGITTLSDGWINFKAKDISKLPSNMYLYLIDAVAGVTQDLKRYPTYRFNLKTGEYNQRFTLVFSLTDLNKPADVVEKMFTIIRTGDHIYVKVNLPFNTKGDLIVTNMAGQTLLRKGVFEMETVEINPNVGSGLYVVTMISGKRKESEKILIRKDYE